MITKIISGFQTGADIGAILAAKDCGIDTGGRIPKGFLTEDGPRPEYATFYGAVETARSDYKQRTAANVVTSQCTLWIGTIYTPGYFCTFDATRRLVRPFLHVGNPRDPMWRAEPWIVLDWIEKNEHSYLNNCIINVAGNRESTNPGIEEFTYKYIKELIEYQRSRSPSGWHAQES